jgi:hypothetical protein
MGELAGVMVPFRAWQCIFSQKRSPGSWWKQKAEISRDWKIGTKFTIGCMEKMAKSEGGQNEQKSGQFIG